MNPILLWYRTTPPVTRRLLTAVVGVYAAYLVVGLFAFFVPALRAVVEAFAWLALDPAAGVVARRPWTVLTHPFVELTRTPWGLIGVVFAGMFLNLLGRDAEGFLGGRWLTTAWFGATLGASVLAVAVAAVAAGPLVFGPWTAVIGLLMALGLRFPDKTVPLFLIGAVRMRYVAIGVVVLGLLFNPFGAVADIGALLGGGLVGYGTARGLSVPVGLPRTAAERPARPGAARRAPERPRATSTEVDRILEKISAHGVGALTDEERRVLDEASRRR